MIKESGWNNKKLRHEKEMKGHKQNKEKNLEVSGKTNGGRTRY